MTARACSATSSTATSATSSTSSSSRASRRTRPRSPSARCACSSTSSRSGSPAPTGIRAPRSPFPVVVVTRVLRQLLALPVEIAYRLAEVSEHVQPSNATFATVYRPRARFTFPLSNRMRSDVLFHAWRQGDPGVLAEALEDVAKEIDYRLRACFSVVSGLTDRTRERLFAYAPRFLLPALEHFAHPTLSKLAFMTRYEQVLGYLETRGLRAAHRDERLERGNALRFILGESLSQGRWRARWQAELAPESRHQLPEEGGLRGHILVPDTSEGDREQMRFSDMPYRSQQWVPRRIAVTLADIAHVSPDRTEVELDVALGADSPELRAGDPCLFLGRYLDWNSDRVLAALQLQDGVSPCPFASLVEDPYGALRQRIAPGPLATPAAVGPAWRPSASLAPRGPRSRGSSTGASSSCGAPPGPARPISWAWSCARWPLRSPRRAARSGSS